jgi:hypothetical protein
MTFFKTPKAWKGPKIGSFCLVSQLDLFLLFNVVHCGFEGQGWYFGNKDPVPLLHKCFAALHFSVDS